MTKRLRYTPPVDRPDIKVKESTVRGYTAKAFKKAKKDTIKKGIGPR